MTRENEIIVSQSTNLGSLLEHRYLSSSGLEKAQSIIDSYDIDASTKLSPQVTATIKDIFPYTIQRNILFGMRSGWVMIDELYRLYHDPEQAVINEEDFRAFTSGNKLNKVARAIGYVTAARDQELRDWMAGKTNATMEEILPLFKGNLFRAQNIESFVYHQNRDEILRKLSYKQVTKWLSTPNSINFDCLYFILDNPEYIDMIADRNYPSWGKRLLALERLQAYLGFHGITDQEVNQYFLDNWQPVNQEQYWWKNNFSSLPYGQQQYIIARLRNNRTFPQTQIRWQAIRQTKGLDPESIPKIEYGNTHKFIDIQENPLHPINGFLIPTFGYEIEAHSPQMFPKAYYELLSRLGFGKENDLEIEFAHGPFQHPFTAARIFEQWTNGGLFDLYRNDKQTFHFNEALESEYLMILLIRGLQTTVDSYYPRVKKSQSPADEYKMIIRYRNSSYTEAKHLRVLTKEGFDRSVCQGMLTGATLKAYEQTLFILQKITPGQVRASSSRRDNPIEINLFDITADEINNAPTTIDQKRLAILGKWYIENLRDGFEQAGLGGLLNDPSPMKQMQIFANTIRTVIPDRYAWYDVDPQDVLIPGQQIYMFGKEFNNIIAFSRHLHLSTAQSVDKILADTNTDMFHLLRQIHSSRNKQKTAQYITTFFKRFPKGIKKETKLVEKVERMDQLLKLFEDYL